MQIDLNHIHHWMQAIRQSNNPMRTMDAFWSGQLKSKEWLIDSLLVSHKFTEPVTIDIHGGWVGVLASMFFQSGIPIKHIRSIDIDPTVQHVAEEMNRLEANEGRFSAITSNMVKVQSDSDIVINTSTEHITQDAYDTWLSMLPQNSIVIVQGNNYAIPEHIRISKDIHEFEQQSKLDRKFVGTLTLPLYERYLIIGKKPRH